MAAACGELLLATQRVRRQTPPEHPPRRGKLTLGGVGTRLNGQAIWGASKSFWISGQCLGSPIMTIWLFGLLSNVPNGPFAGRLPRDPQCQGRAGTTAPGVMPALSPGP